MGASIVEKATTAFAQVTDDKKAQEALPNLIEQLNAISGMEKTVKNIVINGYTDANKGEFQKINITIEFNENVTLTGEDSNFEQPNNTTHTLSTKNGIPTKIPGTLKKVDISTKGDALFGLLQTAFTEVNDTSKAEQAATNLISTINQNQDFKDLVENVVINDYINSAENQSVNLTITFKNNVIVEGQNSHFKISPESKNIIETIVGIPTKIPAASLNY